MSGAAIFFIQKLDPKRGRSGVESPSKAAKERVILKVASLNP